MFFAICFFFFFFQAEDGIRDTSVTGVQTCALPIWHRSLGRRRAAGLGLAPTQADPDRYAQRYAHCDVLVLGAGPAGIAAAFAAADLGARVILCDEQSEFGGSLLGDGAARIDGTDALLWVQQSVA